MTSPNGGAPAVEAVDLGVALGQTQVLSNITFTIQPGEAVALMGANGSGKSTLVKALLGLIRPTQGQTRLFGLAPGRTTDWPAIAYVPQASPAGSGVPTSALEVVRAGMVSGWKPWPPAGSKQRALAALETVGLGAKAHHTMATLSGGQRQRVLVARALARRPRLLIMDEPTAGVDRETQQDLVQALASQRAQGAFDSEPTTALIVLHEVGPFDAILTRDIVLADGQVKLDHPIDQHTDEPCAEHIHRHDRAIARPQVVPEIGPLP